MVLMKFRSGKKAKEWQKDWNGKVFNSMEVSAVGLVLVSIVSHADFLHSQKRAMSFS
jgi:BRCA1-associated protein